MELRISYTAENLQPARAEMKLYKTDSSGLSSSRKRLRASGSAARGLDDRLSAFARDPIRSFIPLEGPSCFRGRYARSEPVDKETSPHATADFNLSASIASKHAYPCAASKSSAT